MARVRLAYRDDIPALRALCRDAVGPDDYVLGSLSWMVREREAIVVEERGRLVALAGVTECADRALWVGQLRTHPDFRRKGFATMLLEHARARAARERRPALRLFTGHRNPSRALYVRSGFREVAGFTRVSAPALRKDPTFLRPDHDGRAAYRRWRDGLFARAGRGYAAYQWHMLPLTIRTLRLLVRNGDVLAGGRAVVLAWQEEGERAAFASILAGGVDGFRAARAAAWQLERTAVDVCLPMDRRILGWASESGFRPAAWGHHLVLYERRVRRRG